MFSVVIILDINNINYNLSMSLKKIRHRSKEKIAIISLGFVKLPLLKKFFKSNNIGCNLN